MSVFRVKNGLSKVTCVRNADADVAVLHRTYTILSSQNVTSDLFEIWEISSQVLPKYDSKIGICVKFWYTGSLNMVSF